MPVYYDDVARRVRAVLAARRTPEEWAAIEPLLLRLRDAVGAGAEAGIKAADDALAALIDERRVDGFGDDLDAEDDGVTPDQGLRELVNSLLSDLGFPDPTAGEEPEERR